MGYEQVKRPNPNIPCKPGWCLAYVNEAFGVPKKYPSATSAWYGSKTKHEDRNFPAGVAVPVWYGLDTTPLGHVVVRMPDGSVYSTSDLTNIPHHHPDLADLERYYAYYGMNLTYRGWTEDVEDTPIVAPAGIAAMGESITPLSEEDDMPLNDNDKAEIKRLATEGAMDALKWAVDTDDGKKLSVYGMVGAVLPKLDKLPDAFLDTPIQRRGTAFGDNGGFTTPRARYAYGDQQHFEQLAASAAAAHADGASADQIIQTVKDALKGATITLGGK